MPPEHHRPREPVDFCARQAEDPDPGADDCVALMVVFVNRQILREYGPVESTRVLQPFGVGSELSIVGKQVSDIFCREPKTAERRS